MNSIERQAVILGILCRNRCTTVKELMEIFGVSRRTICRDILTLSCKYPVKPIRGNQGGIFLEDWFFPSQQHLCPEQMMLLKELLPMLDEQKRKIVNSILLQFAPGITL